MQPQFVDLNVFVSVFCVHHFKFVKYHSDFFRMSNRLWPVPVAESVVMEASVALAFTIPSPRRGPMRLMEANISKQETRSLLLVLHPPYPEMEQSVSSR